MDKKKGPQIINEEPLWKDRKRTLFGLPWSFTRYRLTGKKLVLKKGFFTLTEDEILLYRVLDMRLIRTMGQRMFGLGTIVLISGDATSPEFKMLNIKRSEKVRDLISQLVEEERARLRLQGRELFGIADSSEDVAEASGDHIG
jgi:uncharacterized membrane protein YdbT with pleckstrin-like domain